MHKVFYEGPLNDKYFNFTVLMIPEENSKIPFKHYRRDIRTHNNLYDVIAAISEMHGVKVVYHQKSIKSPDKEGTNLEAKVRITLIGTDEQIVKASEAIENDIAEGRGILIFD